jgi:hypothetical protein
VTRTFRWGVASFNALLDFSSQPLKLGRPGYFRWERFFGRFGQLIKSIFAAIAVSFDLSLLPIH